MHIDKPILFKRIKI